MVFIFRISIIHAYHKRQLWGNCFRKKFRIYFFISFNSKGFNRKIDAYVLRFSFYEYLRTAEKKKKRKEKKQTNKINNKKTSEICITISLEWLNNALFGKDISLGCGLGVFRNALR